MLGSLALPLSPWELLKRTAKEVNADDVLNLAAQQAYYFFFALFPALLALISIASFFPVENLMDEVVALLGRFAPREVLTIITDQIAEISQSRKGGVLTFAFLLTIWSSSGAMVSIISTSNAAYDITESRPFWKVRLTAIALTLGISVFILASISLVLLGPTVAEYLATRVGLGEAFKWTWWVLQWPIVFALVATAIGIIYYFAPDADQQWVWITPGSVLATLLWLVVSLGLKLYLTYFGSYNETYGTIGGIIVLMLWFYLTALAILVGAELNAEIEHASPYGKDVGERVPGEKKKIGVLAQREYEKRRARGEVPVPPFPDDVNCDLDRSEAAGARGGARAGRDENGVRPSELIIGTAALIPAAVKIARSVRQKFDRDAA